MDLSGKVAIVTGASAGIGRAYALALAGAGATVVAAARRLGGGESEAPDANTLATLVNASAKLPGRIHAQVCDVELEADIVRLVEQTAVNFGRIDVLVNNAANFYAGYFEELTPEQIEKQLATSLWGPMNVTRAVLPQMRKQRSGHIICISSLAGLVGFEFGTAYAASKFGLEGWMASLHPEIAPFGIHTTLVNPGFFRSQLLSEESTTYATPSIEDYAERRKQQMTWWKAQGGRQPGDPAKLAQALIKIGSEEPPPRRFIAGADAIGAVELKAAELRAQTSAYREISTAMGHDG
jgi:NAD(P)-dependent dehydrogenase (short-subunit alcohol dehydrogenase family)